MDKIESLLADLNIFQGLNKELIHTLAQKAILKKYRSEEILFFDGEVVNLCYIIVSGRVKISKFTSSGKEKIIHILEEGAIINEISLDDRRSSVTAEMIEDGEILSINIDSLLSLMESNFDLTLHVLASTNLKLRQTYRQIRNLGLKTTGPRIASRLWKLARDYGRENNKGVKIDLNLSQRDLALMIGTSRETVSRFLSKLDRENIVKVGKNQITILNLERLEDWT